MTKFRVFENGERCCYAKIPRWDKDTFDTKREAEVFALLWCYPYTQEIAEKHASTMQIGKEYDLSM